MTIAADDSVVSRWRRIEPAIVHESIEPAIVPENIEPAIVPENIEPAITMVSVHMVTMGGTMSGMAGRSRKSAACPTE